MYILLCNSRFYVASDCYICNHENRTASNGITLYGKYKDQTISGKHEVLFSFENITPQSKRVFMNKKVFGYNQNGKHYDGLLSKFNGIRIGKGTIIVPSEHGDKLLDFFRSLKINVRILKFINYF